MTIHPQAPRLVLSALLALCFLAVPDAAWAQAVGGIGGAVGGSGDPVTIGNNFLRIFLALCAIVLVAMWCAVGFMMWRGMAGLVSIAGAAGGTVVILCAAYFAAGGGGGATGFF